ncbi:MAG: single-stranded-DNA-specific exonuclease RecJ [Oscillospiraceae bacterium]|jgi:single-stranded-DNA-specific exonuclease|nr:single-stranded-DNA-specific exonuclease RecJ [Oscillospiraceae bacterium]
MKFVDWVIRGFDKDVAAAFCRNNMNPLVSVFLASRGITTASEAGEFMASDISAVHDPFLLLDMDKAVSRVSAAIAGGEHIAVFGDYDVDGMTASALMAGYLRSRGASCEIYIPGREEEGYGVNCPALDTLRGRGVTLVVTVDCGVTAVREAEYAKSVGIDIVVTDHHECKDGIPDAAAVVDPKRPDCPYPNKALSGVGVAFKLVCAMERGTKSAATLLDMFGDYVAIGTIADIMPVVGENRVLIRRGLVALNKKRRPGLRRLMEEACSDRSEVNTSAVGFMLAPRLNAAGRMGRTSLSVDVLMTRDDGEAARLTAELCALNAQRKRVESEIYSQALEMLWERAPDGKGPIVLARSGWFQGVLGIVAARIAERSMFPAVMIGVDENGVGRGSCRSFGTFRMYSALRTCEDLLINYGGHEMAAGLTIPEDNIEQLRRRLREYYDEHIKIAPIPTIYLDFEVEKPTLLTLKNVSQLEKCEPFGNGFIPPCMCFRNARLASLQSVGAGAHCRMKVEKGGKIFDCIFFSATPESTGCAVGDRIDLAFAPQVNEFRGWKNVQLHVIDIRRHTLDGLIAPPPRRK